MSFTLSRFISTVVVTTLIGGVASAQTPTASLSASPQAILTGQTSTLSWSTTNATTASINQGIGTVATSGTRTVTATQTTTYTITATRSGGGSATATVTVTVTSPHTEDRANSYDDAWQSGTNGWVANAKAILASRTGQVPGLVLWIGDSLTRHTAMGAWAQNGAGKTAEDQMITTWMHAGLSPKSIDSVDGFALATPYHCSARSYTVGDGLGSWHFMGNGMPADTNPTTAKQKLENCSTYPNMLNLTTMLAALQKPQFAIPEVNLDAANPASFPSFDAMINLMISKGIVPIIITYTYRGDAAFNLLVDQYNAALIQYAQTKKLPLIDFNREMLLRVPFSQWNGRFLGDGVHYTSGTTTYPATGDPYANGGDPATHATGIGMTYNGYGLKGWLGVQKMKEIKALVIDSQAPAMPTVTLTASPQTIGTGQSSTLTWTTANATSVSINQGIGTVALSGNRIVTPAVNTTYTLTATGPGGTSTAGVTVTVAPPPVVTFTAAPLSIRVGDTTTLTWAVANATSVNIDQEIGNVASSASLVVAPITTTTYHLVATGTGGLINASVTVEVLPGHSEILWRHSSGAVTKWLMDGTQNVGTGQLGTVEPAWRIDGTGDYNGDGQADILWRHPAGAVFMWLMNGTQYVGGGVLGTIDPAWQIVGSGDYNGDGRADILWRHSAGAVIRWLMNGTQTLATEVLGTIDPAWQIVGSGDYNGDGQADILWRHSSGSVLMWFMNGTQSTSAPLGTIEPAWQIVGAGDYNGDGRADILWRHSAGAVIMWLMNGSQNLATAVLGTIDPAWQIVGAGDYNGDGRADILWRHSAGSVNMWLMDGTQNLSTGSLGAIDPAWQIVYAR